MGMGQAEEHEAGTRNRAETIVYPVGDGLYVNLTNRCSCACTFCIRQKAVGVGVNESGDDNELWLDHEPDFNETMAAFDAYDMSRATEVVFCGYGEPTCRFDLLKQAAREVRRRWRLPVRVNTNGQGSLINGRDIAPEFAGIIDAVSISLNAPDAETYQRIVRSRFGTAGFDAMLAFAKEVREYVPNVTLTTVSTTISHADEERCRQLCEQLGVRYRIRAFA